MLSQELGFNKEERCIHLRRVAYVCNLLTKNGVIAISATISPYEDIRNELGDDECLCRGVYKMFDRKGKKRDVKGLYEKACNGEIKLFTGITDKYETPTNAEITVNSEIESIDQSTRNIIIGLNDLGYLKRRHPKNTNR